MTNAVRQQSPETTSSRRAAQASVSSATVIPLSATPGRKAGMSSAAAPDIQPPRRRSRGSDLVLGGGLAVILLIACLTWEVLRDVDVPHATLHGTQPGATATTVR